MKTHLPPGMLTMCMEFFLNNGELLVITNGKLFPFHDAPLSILEQLNNLLEQHPEAIRALDEMGLESPVDRLEQFAKCWFGDYDLKVDICQDGVVASEYYDCGSRGTCPYEGKLCPGIKVNDQYLTQREIEVCRLICEDLPNKMIADQLGISPLTIMTHIRNIHQKTGTYSKAGIVAFSYERGLI